jgi:hypothetical protein
MPPVSERRAYIWGVSANRAASHRRTPLHPAVAGDSQARLVSSSMCPQAHLHLIYKLEPHLHPILRLICCPHSHLIQTPFMRAPCTHPLLIVFTWGLICPSSTSHSHLITSYLLRPGSYFSESEWGRPLESGSCFELQAPRWAFRLFLALRRPPCSTFLTSPSRRRAGCSLARGSHFQVRTVSNCERLSHSAYSMYAGRCPPEAQSRSPMTLSCSSSLDDKTVSIGTALRDKMIIAW